MISLFMRSLIMSLLVLHLLLPGAYSEGDDRKPQRPLMCKNPKAKEDQSTWQGCSTATCKRIGKQALWQPCPKVGLEQTVKENDEKIERNHEMSLEILKIIGNCCPTTTTWDPASTTLIRKVDGKWSPWGTWASCDSSSGTKKRMRQCDSPSPQNGGESCAGSSQESENCPVDGKWSPWGTWASCDSSSGTKKRMRQCDSPSPKNGGESCAGSSQESATCRVDGGWNNWGSWASCDSSTGYKKKVRQCNNPSPKNGGAYCAGSSYYSLTCPVDGGWNNWGNWGSCDSNTGYKKRYRQCNNPSPKNGGASCPGHSYNSLTCIVDGGWNNWGNWGSCDSNTGTKKRYRQCYNPSPKNGGAYCAGNSQESTTATCPGCPAGWSFYESSCYRFYSASFSWTKAQEECQKEKSILASVTNVGIKTFIGGLQKDRHAYIGGSRPAGSNPNLGWKWLAWSYAWSYQNWDTGEPNNANNNEFCLEQLGSAYGNKWYDASCSIGWSNPGYVCEKHWTAQMLSK